jgi:hypothetical protein
LDGTAGADLWLEMDEAQGVTVLAVTRLAPYRPASQPHRFNALCKLNRAINLVAVVVMP